MTTSVCRLGSLQIKEMPFGLINACLMFPRMMERIGSLLFVCVYLDYLSSFSKSLTEHVEDVSLVIVLFSEGSLEIKLSKCQLTRKQVELLAHIVAESGVQLDSEKVSVIQKMTRSSSQTAIRTFLGISRYYRRFIRSFVAVIAQLHADIEIC